MKSKAEFKVLNGDDEGNAAQKEKYGIRGYPTLIYTDSSGKEVSRSGGFGSAEEFAGQISSMVGK